MPEETNCEEHDRKIIALDTTVTNGKWIMAASASVLGFALMFVGWVANDNLSGMRGDFKEIKGMLMSIQRDTDANKIEIGYIKTWKLDVDEHIKRGK